MNAEAPAGGPQRWDAAQIARLLVMRLDNVGDVVMLTPALRALRNAFPAARITLLASPAAARLAPLLPWVNEVQPARALWQDASGGLPFDPDRERAFIANLAAGRYDAAIISTSFAQSAHAAAYACYLAGIPLRAGFAPDFAGAVLSHPVPSPPSEEGHQVDRALALVSALGVRPIGAHLELRVPHEVERGVASLLTEVTGGRPYVALAPGASCPSRRYHPERFGRVAGELGARTGLPVLVIGSEREVRLAARVVEVAATSDPGATVTAIAGRTTLPQLAALVRTATLIISNNSGLMHLADAFARPSVVLFAGTERTSEYAPRAAPLRLLRQATACAPCRAFACPFAMECLDIPPQTVVRAALELLLCPSPPPSAPPARLAAG